MLRKGIRLDGINFTSHINKFALVLAMVLIPFNTFTLKLIVRLIIAFLLGSSCNLLLAQTPPVIQWQKSAGGSLKEGSVGVYPTPDGGYITAGYTRSNDGEVSGLHGGSDCWVVKLDSARNIQWQKCYGGSGDESANSFYPVADGGYIICGTSNSDDGDVTGHHGLTNFEDIWVLKIDSLGNLQWQRSYGGTSFENVSESISTADGGFIIAGTTNSNNGDVTARIGGSTDVWIIKTDSWGNIQWQKCYGGLSGESASSIKQTTDGGYIFAGLTYSNDVDVSGNHSVYPFCDSWVVKINNTGLIVWQKCLGGTKDEHSSEIKQVFDGGYILAASSSSNDGDVSGHHGEFDYWVVKLSEEGNIEWQKCLGGSDNDFSRFLDLTVDGGYVVTGYTFSRDGDITNNFGPTDNWIMKLTSTGSIDWQKCYGGTGVEIGYFIKSDSQGGYFFAGVSTSNDGEVSENHGNSDFWIGKLGAPPCIPSININSDRTTICNGSTIRFTSSITNGGSSPNYLWTVNGVALSSRDSVFTTLSLANNDTVRCILTSNAGCANVLTDTSNAIIVSVLPILSPIIDIAASDTVACSTEPITFTATAVNIGTSPFYQWFLNSLPSGSNSNIFTTSSLNSNDVITCTVTSNSGCVTDSVINSNPVRITIRPAPIASIYPVKLSVCDDEPALLNAIGGSFYQWQLNGNDILGATSSEYNADQAGIYNVRVSDGFCSSLSLNNSVVSILKSESGNSRTIYLATNTAYTLQARNIGQIFSWTPSIGLSNTTISNPVLTTNENRTYFVQMSSSNMCPVTDTIIVEVFTKSGVYIPTAFTPNNDKLNDILIPINIHIKEIKSFVVFNRWGQQVFYTNKIGQGWDGMYKGVLQPKGVYTWIFEGIDKFGRKIEQKGNSILL